MSLHLRIERLVITGLAPGQPALALRDEVERALAGLLSRQAIELLRSAAPARLPPIDLATAPPGRTVAMHVALAIRDALTPREETAR